MEVNTVVSPQNTRYFYMDNLRAIAMFAGIVFHALLSYSLLLHEGWPTADTSSSVIVDAIAWLSHMFRMPVFFLIAGFFACYLIQKRGVRGFINNRLMRIALPFIVFWPVVFIAVVGSLVFAASSTSVDTPIINFIRLGMENPEQAGQEQSPLTTMHLWFLYYLFMFCLATAVLQRFVTLPKNLKLFILSPVSLTVLLPLVTSVSFFQQHMPHPAPESFKPALWPFLYYGSFFFVGWLFFQNQHILEKLKPWVYPMLAVCVLSYGIFFSMIPREIAITEMMANAGVPPELNSKHLILSICTSILSWHLTLLSLLAAIKFLNNSNEKIRFIADSSYWVYILHIPVLFGLQLYFHTLEWPIIIEVTLSIALTLAIGLISYGILIRPTPIGWMLNGKKTFQASEVNKADNGEGGRSVSLGRNLAPTELRDMEEFTEVKTR